MDKWYKKWLQKIERQFEPVKPTEAELNMMFNSLTEEQKRVAEAMSEFMSTTVAEWGNDVTMELYGYKKFTNQQYFPLFSDRMYLNQVIKPEVNFATLKNLGFSKARKPQAKNPLVVGDVFTIFDRHISDMAAYSGYVLPLTDFNRIYNYALSDGQTIKGLLDRQLGQNGTKYIRDFIISVNGDRVMTAPEDTIYDKLIRNYKAAAVGFNLSTAALQPLSYVRALSELDAKYLIKAATMKGNREEMLKYSGIAKIKSWGFSEIGIGKKFHQLYDDSETTVMQKIRDASMYLAGKADEVTWERLWNAVKLEILDTTDLVEGTEDFYQAVSERFDDVIGKTQVVHSIFDTPPIMRNHNTFYRMAFAFMSEPFKSVNNLRIDLQKFILSQSDAAKNKLARTALVTALNAAAAATLRSIVSMLRDEEDEEYTKEDANAFLKFLKNFGDNMIGEVASFVPFADDLLDMAKGYDLKRIDLAGINDLFKALDRAMNPNSTATTFVHVRDIASGLGYVLGLPIKTVVKDMTSILRDVAQFTDYELFEYEIVKLNNKIDGSTGRGKAYDLMYKAWTDVNIVDRKK